MNLSELDRELASRRADRDIYRPEVVTYGAPLAALLEEHQDLLVTDEIQLQLTELVQTLAVGTRLAGPALEERVRAHLAGKRPAEYGSWVYYPWSRRLVHVLPRDEYRFLRTNRNRNRITEAEQKKLQAMTIGVVGLSVGQATAVTLALEGIGGTLRLADFDWLGLSNMNRMRVGAHSLGMNKAIMTAREIYEIDPYADVEIFEAGVTDATLDAFLEGMDLVFEQCDDVSLKFRLRQRARERRIAVVMETGDRGLIDIERFDREPDRPIFHGLTRSLDPAKLKNLTMLEKVPIMYEVIGRTMSKRSAASMVDVDTTLYTWPQLASGVSLGAALNTDVARRIGLGSLNASGRYFVDLDELIADGNAAPHLPPVVDEPDEQGELEALPPLAALPSSRTSTMDWEIARTLVGYGVLAPSGGNCQPWRFSFANGALSCIHDLERSRSVLDFESMGAYMALGSVSRNVELAASVLGLETKIVAFPDGPVEPGASERDGRVICRVETARATRPLPVNPLAGAIQTRVTNRRMGAKEPLAPAHRDAMLAAAERAGGRLQFLDGAKARELAKVLAEGDRMRLLSQSMHRDMMKEMRWTRAEAATLRDGIELSTLELTAADRVGLRMSRDWPLMQLLRDLDAGQGLGRPTIKAIDLSSAVGLLTVEGHGAQAFFHGGRVLEDVWLAAAAHRVAVQPVSAIVGMFLRLERGGGAGLSASERESLARLRSRYLELFQLRQGESEMMVFRVFYAPPPTARSVRRRVDDVLVQA